jgi:hypothetical protein
MVIESNFVHTKRRPAALHPMGVKHKTYRSLNRKESIMKRIIAAVSFAALVVPAFSFAADTSAPYEKTQFDRMLPNIERAAPAEQASASSGPSSAADANLATGVWAHDHNFISPAE